MLFVYKPTTPNILTLKSILRCYKLTSELKVNFYKIRIRSLRVNFSVIERVSLILNCITMTIPFTYLGVFVWGKSQKNIFLENEKNKKKISYMERNTHIL